MGSLSNTSILKGPTRAVKPALLHKLFEETALKFPDSPALIYEDATSIHSWKYSQLNAITNQIARAISDCILGSEPNNDGDFIVAVCIPPSDKLISTLLGIWKAGAAYLPLDVAFPPPRVEHIIKEAKPVLVITETGFDLPELVPHKTYSELIAEAKTKPTDSLKDTEIVKHREGNLAIAMYTSGSTGVPKGVRLPHEVIMNRLQWQFHAFPYSDTEKNCIFKTSLTFVDSVSEIWGPLINGLTIVIIPKKVIQDPEKLVKKMEEYKIERLVLVPSLLRSILLYLDLQSELTNPLSNLRWWVCSGEPLSVPLAQDFFKRFPNNHQLCNFYGSTEIMGDVTYYILENEDQLINKTKVPIGIPLDNSIIYLLDPQLRPVEIGTTGELWVSGANLAKGYVNGRDPDRFIPNPLGTSAVYDRLYRTGDYAKIEKGVVVYEGRMDSQVKVRGHRVDLSEVERATSTLPGVEKAIVLCYHPGDEDQTILAFVTLNNNCLLNEIQLEKTLEDRLPPYMLPQVIIIQTIPLLVNGKIDRQTLLKSYENTNNNDDKTVEIEIDYAGVPESQMEAAKVLLETVASILNRSARSAIKIDANFYEIGGNSLNSIVTITKLNEKGYYISISDFINAKDLRQVLDHMSPEKIIPTKTIEGPKYVYEQLRDEHKQIVFDMITISFYQKADLEQWLMPDIYVEDYPELLQHQWAKLLETGLSFLVKRPQDGTYIGVALNLDAYDEPEFEVSSKLEIIFEFLDFLEKPIKETHLPKGVGKILHCSMMGTSELLDAKENVSVMQFMEEETLRLAHEKKFTGVLTVNTSPLTQQFGKDIYGYEVLLDYQVNQFVSSAGTKPFGKAPDSQRAMVCWKTI